MRHQDARSLPWTSLSWAWDMTGRKNESFGTEPASSTPTERWLIKIMPLKEEQQIIDSLVRMAPLTAHERDQN
jgi:hypothetical protein